MEPALLYQWINFILFSGLLVYFLREPLRDFLGDRSERLRRELERIADRRKAAEASLRDYQKRLAALGEEIRKLTEEFHQEGEIEKGNLILKAKVYAEKVREDAKRMGEQELGKARHFLKRKTFLLAVDLAQKKLQEAVGSQDQERLAWWGIQHLEKIHEGTGIS